MKELKLSQEELEQIQDLAGINYGPEQIAMYLNIDSKSFVNTWKKKESQIRYYYDRGMLLTDANIQIKLKQSAEKGNITAAQMIEKKRRENEIEVWKKEIFNL